MKKKFSLLLALIVVVIACILVSCSNADKHNSDLEEEVKKQDIIDQKTEISVNDRIVNDDGIELAVDLTKKGSISASAEDISSNKIILFGKSYEFPLRVSVLLNDGWSFSENINFKNEFKAKTKTSLTSFHLANPEGNEITLRYVYNDAESDSSIEDCLLTGIQISIYQAVDENSWVLPGGINAKSTALGIISVYGNPNKNSNFDSGYNLASQLTYNEQNKSGISYSFSIVDSDHEKGDMLYGYDGYIEQMSFECK